MVRWIEQHGHTKQAAQSLDAGCKLTRSFAMPRRCGAMDLLLRLDLHELTSNRCEHGRRVAGHPNRLPCEQRLTVLGKALEAAPVRSCDLELAVQLVGLRSELRCARLPGLSSKARPVRNPRDARGPLLRNHDVGHCGPRTVPGPRELCGLLIAPYEPDVA